MTTSEFARRTISPASARRPSRLIASLVIVLSLAACAVVPIDEYGDPVPVSPAEAAVSTAIVTFGALHFLGALGRHRGHHHWGSRGHGPRGFDRGHRSGRGWSRGHRPRGSERSFRRRGRDGGGSRGGRPPRSQYSPVCNPLPCDAQYQPADQAAGMRNVNADNITETFLSYFGPDTDPRLKEIMTSLSRHLHDFARETRLTHAEWQKGLEVLRRAGDITTDDRNEFILMSDVLGLSSLVDMLHSPAQGTNSSVLGPFHIANSPNRELGTDLRGDSAGELVLVQGQVRNPDGQPIAGATLDIWQTAPNGLYSSQDPAQDRYNFHALFTTDEQGHYRFTTGRPVSYTVPTDGPVGDLLNATGRHPWRPSHLHYMVSAPGYRTLVTEVFPDSDPYLDEDTVFGVRDDLIMTYVPQKAADFPADGFALSGKVNEDYSRVDFDVVLVAQGT